MDTSVLWKLSYGMYAIGTLDGTRPTGCIVNTVVQITSGEPIIAVSMNKDNFTYTAIRQTKRFAVSILSEQTNQNVIAALGFASGRDRDKFDGRMFDFTYVNDLPVVQENACGYLIAEVTALQETSTHMVILARVTDAASGANFAPMTYRYYHDVIKGKAPKNAPTYRRETAAPESWVCDICGYVYEGDLEREPEDFICPVCKQPKRHFKKQ